MDRTGWGTDGTLWVTGSVSGLSTFEKMPRKEGEDPSIFNIALETLALYVTGLYATDIWIVCHRRPPSRISLTVVECGRAHADTETWRFSKPGPERPLPIYTVDEPWCGLDDWMTGWRRL